MTTDFVLDGLIVALLAATIGFCLLLNRRLGALRRAQDELARFAAALTDATGQAEAAIREFKQSAESLGRELQERMERARTINDDLSFMAQRGTGIADRLELSLQRAKASRPGAAGGAVNPVRSPARERAERELLDALRSVR